MTLENIKKIRDQIIREGEYYSIYTADSKIIEDNIEKSHVLWDDANQIAYSIKTNDVIYHQNAGEISITVFPYDVIEFITVKRNLDGLKEYLDKIKSDVSISDEDVTKIVKDFEPRRR